VQSTAPSPADESTAAALDPTAPLIEAGVTDGAVLLLDVVVSPRAAAQTPAGPVLLPPTDPAAPFFAALVEGRVVGEVITRTLPDGTQRPITVLRLLDGLKWPQGDSDTLLVRPFYDDLYTQVLNSLQPTQVSTFHRLTMAGNPGAFSCEGEGGGDGMVVVDAYALFGHLRWTQRWLADVILHSCGPPVSVSAVAVLKHSDARTGVGKPCVCGHSIDSSRPSLTVIDTPLLAHHHQQCPRLSTPSSLAGHTQACAQYSARRRSSSDRIRCTPPV
jgi:hypothetical protein